MISAAFTNVKVVRRRGGGGGMVGFVKAGDINEMRERKKKFLNLN